MDLRKITKNSRKGSKTTNQWKFGLYGLGIALIFVALIAYPAVTSKLSAQEIAAIPAYPKINFFASTTIQASAAYVYDLKTNQALYAKNATESLPLASLTKLMMMVTALDSAPTSTEITITPSSLATDGDSGLYEYEHWDLQTLLTYTLVVSSNDGAVAVSEALGTHPSSDTPSASSESRAVFVGQMNLRAEQLGLTASHFINESGLDIDTTHAGAYGSAEDVEKLLTYAVSTYPDIMDKTRDPGITVRSLSGIIHTGENTDVLTGKIPGLVAGKTGYTDLAGGNLAVITDVFPNHPVAVVVLGSSYDGRFVDVATLISAAKKAVLEE